MRTPIIRFLDSNKEPSGARTLLVQLLFGCVRNRISEGLNRGQIVERPGLPNREGTISILPSLVHAYAA